jgi:hypothetical protein
MGSKYRQVGRTKDSGFINGVFTQLASGTVYELPHRVGFISAYAFRSWQR